MTNFYLFEGTPSRILDFCELVGENIQLPEYMAQFARLHRRREVQVSYSDGDYYSTTSDSDGGYYSTTSDSDGGYYSTTAYGDSVSSQQSVTVISATQASATATASTGSETITSTPTSTTTGSASTVTASSSSSSGLSTGAKAGIGVAIPLVVIVLGLSLFWYFRKRRENRRTGAGNNIPEISQQPWPEEPSPASKNLPAEADSTALHEADSSSVFESPPLAAGTLNPGVYELSGNSAVQYPPAAALATHKHRISLGHHSSKTYSSVSNEVSRQAFISAASTPASETISSGGLDASMSALTDSGTPSQNPQVNTREGTEQPSSGVESTDMQLAQLEAEMARIAEERERLQQMQVLADKEAELKRQIAARKATISGANPDSYP
ncbi:uncharacterized protein N7482_008406 [Penicillium canariense]|uniref:Uncharacterized protein n=1 Tax=Penicillium canariense TaxID=189055 RepID=A0A9W9HTR5_9EURO|nr:uncharacterized protein N7482_008406 [Penicillium canariense]KAJ5157306.1 hypothetical protein N7482_008406 [Penicillium canariense]